MDTSQIWEMVCKLMGWDKDRDISELVYKNRPQGAPPSKEES